MLLVDNELPPIAAEVLQAAAKRQSIKYLAWHTFGRLGALIQVKWSKT